MKIMLLSEKKSWVKPVNVIICLWKCGFTTVLQTSVFEQYLRKISSCLRERLQFKHIFYLSFISFKILLNYDDTREVCCHNDIRDRKRMCLFDRCQTISMIRTRITLSTPKTLGSLVMLSYLKFLSHSRFSLIFISRFISLTFWMRGKPR